MKKIFLMLILTTLNLVTYIQSDNSTYSFDQGVQAFKNKKYKEALIYFEMTIQTIPESINGYFNAALSCMHLKKWKQATDYFKEVIKRAPSHFNAHFYSARALRNSKKADEAIAAFKKAIRIKPDDIDAQFELGVLYTQQHQYDEALACYDKVLLQTPRCIPALRNAGHTARYQGNMQKAANYYQRGVALKPHQAHLHYGLGESLLALGDFKNGWHEFEFRWKRMPDKRKFSDNQWDGKANLHGKIVVIRAEYGQGDSIQFIRYAQLLKEMGAFVAFEAQHTLLELLASCPYIDKLIMVQESKPLNIKYDYQIPAMSLPYIFNTWSEKDIPKSIPYIWAKPELVDFWKQKTAHDTNFKIGICWQGSPYYEQFKSPLSRKAVPLKLFAQLARIDSVSVYSLQKMNGLEELKDLGDIIIHSYDDFDYSHGRFMDTAALIKNLDLIITVDTSVAHLAGALGAPTWVLLPYVADWRWMQNRSDCPWYQTMRLFRQSQPGDWQSVIDQIITLVSEKLGA